MKIEDVRLGMRVVCKEQSETVLTVKSIDTDFMTSIDGYCHGKIVHLISFIGSDKVLTAEEIEPFYIEKTLGSIPFFISSIGEVIWKCDKDENGDYPLFSGHYDGNIIDECLRRKKARCFSDVKIHFEGFNKCELKPISRMCRCITTPIYIQQLGRFKKQKESKMNDLKVGDIVSIVNTKGLRRIIDVNISRDSNLIPRGEALISFDEWDEVKDCRFRISDVKSNGRYNLAGVFGKSFDRDDLKKIETKRRMTNLELAKWSEMHGQVKYNGIICAKWSYKTGEDYIYCLLGVKIRTWNTTDWIEPEVKI